MPTRMERYYQSDSDYKRRTSRNEDLYKTIYDSGEYSNIEGITSLGRTNEIDITKLKEMLKNREDYKKEREYRNIVKREQKVEIPVIEEEEGRTYDIRDILSKAKTGRTEDNKSRSLKNTQYNILKNINIDEAAKKYSEDLEKENQELKELIHTITNTSMLNQLKDNDLSLDLFEDLKSTNNTMVGNSSMKDLLEEENTNTLMDTKENSLIDQSFFTSSLGLNEKDFQDFENFDEEEQKGSSIFFKVIVILLVVTLIVGIVFLLLQTN